MTKAKVAPNDSKNHLKHPKDGSVQKKKQQKFKNTPNGKIPLINGTPSKVGAKQISPKNGNGVMKSPKSPKSPKGQNGAANSKKGVKNSPKSKKKAEEEDDDESEEDFNEGIVISEVVSGQEDEDDDDSSDDDALPDVLMTTLPDVTDESDGDFDVTTAENQGVKMFRGINAPNKETDESSDDDEEEEDDEDDDEEDEDEGKPALGLSALLGDSIKDESGDEDFVGKETSEDDEDEDDDDDEDESDEEVPEQSLNSSTVTSTDDSDEEEDDDEDDDDDDDSSPDLSDLLGTSLVDESDDNDFEADDDDADQDEDISSEEDDDESPESKKKKATESASPEEKAQLKAEQDKRSIFVGNIPKDTKVQVLTREFKKFGPIETVRLRGIIPGDPKMSLKVAAIKRNFHEKSKNICAFIRYENEESVKKALAMNGKKFEGNYLRVDRCERPKASDKKKAVFLGNLPFTVEDNELWEAFKDCGRIESVRIIRHRGTGLGRGFGYINFETSEGAVLALSLDGTEISDRKIRVQSITGQEAAAKKKQSQRKTPEKGGKRKHQSESDSNNSPKKVKTDDSGSVERATHNSVNAERRTKKGKKRSQGDKQRSKSDSSSPKSDTSSPTKFQGQTGAAKNKKTKQDKTSKKKKQMAAKLLAKPKKPSAN